MGWSPGQAARGRRGAPATGAGPSYAPRRPEAAALYRILQEHLRSFEREWTDEAEGRTLPAFVTEKLNGFLGVASPRAASRSYRAKPVAAGIWWTSPAGGGGSARRALGRRMNEGTANLTDHVLPPWAIRQWVLALPHALGFPLAFDGRLLPAVLRIFIDTVARWYGRRQVARNVAAGRCGAVAVIHERLQLLPDGAVSSSSSAPGPTARAPSPWRRPRSSLASPPWYHPRAATPSAPSACCPPTASCAARSFPRTPLPRRKPRAQPHPRAPHRRRASRAAAAATSRGSSSCDAPSR
jgi:hypothetical protein